MYVKVRGSARKIRGRTVKRYTAVWTENGRSYGETFDTREDAEDKLVQVQNLLRQGKSAASLRDLGQETFASVAAHWLETRHDLKPATRAEYTNLLADKTRARKSGAGLSTADLSIASTFGGLAVNTITRADISEWIGKLTAAGKKPSTVRHHYFIVKQVLDQAVADGRLLDNPAIHVKLPTERTVTGGKAGVVDNPDQFLSAKQVNTLVAATPWPCSMLVQLAAWSGLRAAELAGLQVGDVQWPVNSNGTVWLHVRRTVIDTPVGLAYDTTKTSRSERKVPLTPATVEMLRDYLADHPRADEPEAPLFCGVTLTPAKQTGKRAAKDPNAKPLTAAEKAARQADGLAALSVPEASARLVFDWISMLRHQTFYKAVFRPAALRANRLAGEQALPPTISFHALRHSYASLCVAAGIPVEKLSRRLGHSKITTTLDIYTHLFPDDDASDDMAALEAMGTTDAPNVIRMHRRV